MQLDGLALNEDGLEGLNPKAVKSGRAVEHDRVLLNDLGQTFPHLGCLALHQALGALDGAHMPLGLQLVVDEGLEELDAHLLGQSALVQSEVRSGRDDRAPRIIHTLAKQVLPETALLALEHVGEGLERSPVGTGDDPSSPSVVEKDIHRLLQHPFFVAQDDVGGVELHEPLQPVVTVDHAAVEVVEVRGGETSAIQGHQGPQIRGQHRDDLEDHPGRILPRFEVIDLVMQQALGFHQTVDDLVDLG